MSVKLSVNYVVVRYDDIFGRDIEAHGSRPATPAEVAEAHPKCKTCRHRMEEVGHFCENPDSAMYGKFIYPFVDYCRHHSELNKEHDDETTHG